MHPYQTPYSSMNNCPILYNDTNGEKIGGPRTARKAFKQYQSDIGDRLTQVNNMLQDNIQPSDVAGLIVLRNDLMTQQTVANAMASKQRGTPLYVLSEHDGRNEHRVRVNEKRSGTNNNKRLVFNVDFDSNNHNGSFAGAVRTIDLYQQGEWSFTSSRGGEFSTHDGLLTDLQDMREILQSETGWEVNLSVRNLAGEFTRTSGIVNSQLSGSKYDKLRRKWDTDTSRGDNPRRSVNSTYNLFKTQPDGTRSPDSNREPSTWGSEMDRQNTEYRRDQGVDKRPND
jgi:hypothetical protein